MVRARVEMAGGQPVPDGVIGLGRVHRRTCLTFPPVAGGNAGPGVKRCMYGLDRRAEPRRTSLGSLLCCKRTVVTSEVLGAVAHQKCCELGVNTAC